MMARKGFVLLEVVMGLFLGSLIMGVLFQSLSQANQIFSKVTATSSVERKMSLLQQQLDTDFSGIFLAPDSQSFTDQKQEGQEIEKKKKEENEPKETEEDSSDKKKLKGFTLEPGQQGGIEIMSFVTDNPLLTYHQGSPRAVRIAYRIVPDPENEGKLLIVRQQSQELSLEKFQQASRAGTRKEDQQPIRSYELVRNIGSFTCTAFVELIKKPEKEEQEKQVQNKEKSVDLAIETAKGRSFIQAQEWFGFSDEEKKKYEIPTVPTYLKIQVSVVDDLKKMRSFEFWLVAFGGFGRFQREGASELPSENELRGRAGADKENRRIHLHKGIPQP